MIRTGIDNREKIQNEWTSIGCNESLPTSKRECSNLLRTVKKEITAIVSQSYQRREQERQQLIEFFAKSGKSRDQEQATRLRILQKSEAIKICFKSSNRFDWLDKNLE